jgi:hypothetical protein
MSLPGSSPRSFAGARDKKRWLLTVQPRPGNAHRHQTARAMKKITFTVRKTKNILTKVGH